MTKNPLNIIFCILTFVGCNQSVEKQKTQLDKGDYWVVDFKSGSYPAKIFSDNKIYCSSIEITSGLPNYFYCFDFETGKVSWRKQVESWASFSPVVLDTLIYYCSYLGHIYSLNKTGKLRWQQRSLGSYAGHKINPINNNLFVSTVEMGVHEYDYKTGNVIRHVGNRKLGVTLPAVTDSLICFANLGKGNTEIRGNQLICFNYFTNDTLWQKEFVIEQGRPYYKIEKLYADSNRLYFIQGKSTLYCLDFHTGQTIWSKEIDRSYNEKLVFRNDRVFVNARRLYAFNKMTGKEASEVFKRIVVENQILLSDSIQFFLKCQIGSFKNNAEFDNSCEIEISAQAADKSYEP